MNLKKSVIFMLIFSFCSTTSFAQESLKDKARDFFTETFSGSFIDKTRSAIEQGENIYFSQMIKHRCNNRAQKAKQWFNEQPALIKIPVALGAGIIATTAAVSVLHAIAQTCLFIPSCILHPLTTLHQIYNGQPDKILGAVGTVSTAFCAALYADIASPEPSSKLKKDPDLQKNRTKKSESFAIKPA